MIIAYRDRYLYLQLDVRNAYLVVGNRNRNRNRNGNGNVAKVIKKLE